MTPRNFTRLITSSLLLLLINLPVSKAGEPEKASLSFYGFIRNDFYMTTYHGLNTAQDLLYLYPNYIGVDAGGIDLNRQTTASLVSVTSRLGLNIKGPELFKAQSTANMEFDFIGKPEMYHFRIRRAYFMLDWGKSQLLAGQTWHPFGCANVIPYTASLSLGTPFRPLSRSPQLRYEHKTGALKTSFSAVYQLQYLSYGPVGASNIYKRDAVLPELVAGLEYTMGKGVFGGSIDYNTIQPRETTTGSNGAVHHTDELLGSTSFMLFYKVQTSKWWLFVQGFRGQNMAHLTMNGGYGVSSYDQATGKESYTNYNSASLLANLSYGTKWKPGILLGYSKNLGTSDPLYRFTTNGNSTAQVWGLSPSIQSLYRIAPSISYNQKNIQLHLEYEQTGANWGIGTINFENGTYDQSHLAVNHKINFVMTYLF